MRVAILKVLNLIVGLAVLAYDTNPEVCLPGIPGM